MPAPACCARINLMPRVLLTSVFKPFAVDNLYSRRDSKIELYHNQITKYQGVFSIRTHMLSFGLHAIANNINADTTVLEFPTLKRFCRELEKGYDYVGISGIIPNFEKVRRMAREVRKVSPRSTIIIGGFCATVENIREMVDADHVCVGEGISFMRELLGEEPFFEFKSPSVFHELREMMGVPLLGIKNPHIPVGLGCPYGCDFCHPSHFFGRKHIKFFSSGKALYKEMVRVCDKYRTDVVSFIGDDNFLIDLARARELRDEVIKGGREFRIFLFASADRIEKFGVDELAKMGAFQVWIGRESCLSNSYDKNRDIDIKDLISRLRSRGVKTVLSSIILLDEHNRENIYYDIQDHLDCTPDFSQFSFYSPVPGTPLHDRMKESGRLIQGIAFEEMHAFKQPWFVHPHFTLEEAEHVQAHAYLRDFYELGPSLMRWFETDLIGYLAMKDSDDPVLRKRAKALARPMPKFKTVLLAMERLVPTAPMAARAREVRHKIEAEFGETTAFEKSMAAGLTGFGKLRQWRTARFGDNIQPRTRLFHYP